MESLVTYLIAAMVAWGPLRAQTPIESSAAALARYAGIARDVAQVVVDEEETPLFPGPDGRARTALLMLSVASFESSYRTTVDDGIGRVPPGRGRGAACPRGGGPATADATKWRRRAK